MSFLIHSTKKDYFEYPFIEEDKLNNSNFRLIQLFHSSIENKFDNNGHFKNNENQFQDDQDSEDDLNVVDPDALMRKTDEEIDEFLRFDEFYFEKYNMKKAKKKQTKNMTLNNELNLAKNIYCLIKHHFTNPLSLKELSRIQIRKTMCKIDYKIKEKIESHLILPKRLKRFLLFDEFNC